MSEGIEKGFSYKQSRYKLDENLQRKKERKLIGRLARILLWALRIFLSSVILITTYNVALALCDAININYTLWLSSTIASCAFCVGAMLIILGIYIYLRYLTKSLSKTV